MKAYKGHGLCRSEETVGCHRRGQQTSTPALRLQLPGREILCGRIRECGCLWGRVSLEPQSVLPSSSCLLFPPDTPAGLDNIAPRPGDSVCPHQEGRDTGRTGEQGPPGTQRRRPPDLLVSHLAGTLRLLTEHRPRGLWQVPASRAVERENPAPPDVSGPRRRQNETQSERS